jgi:hypothetical protein
VVTPFLGPLGPFQHPVQGVRSRKPVAGVGTVENGNSGKGKGHTAGTTPGAEEFRSGTRVRSPGPTLSNLMCADDQSRLQGHLLQASLPLYLY